VEAKSGYGLDVASELKILRLHRELNDKQPLEIVSTFMGAMWCRWSFERRRMERKNILRC